MNKFGSIFLILFSFLISSCDEKTLEDKVVFKIGVLNNETTPGGVEMMNVVKLFLKEVEKKSNSDGFETKLVIKNISIEPEEARLAARHLVYREEVDLIIGPNISISAIEAATVSELAQVPMISPGATNAIVSLNKKYIYQITFNDRSQGSYLSQYLFEHKDSPPAMVIYQISNPASREVADAFIKNYVTLGGDITQQISYSEFDDDIFKRVIPNELSRSKWILLPNLNEQSIRGIQVLRSMGFKGKFLGSDSWSFSNEDDIASFGEAIVAQHWFYIESQSSNKETDFYQKYTKTFSAKPASTAALTFDSFMFAYSAFKKNLRSGISLNERLKTHRFNGVTGQIDFSKENNERKPVLISAKDGKTTLLTNYKTHSTAPNENMSQ